MGLFQQLPEDPTEWAGLPGEPLDPASPAEELSVAHAVDAASLGLGGSSATEAIVVAMPALPPDAAEPHG